MARRKHKAGYGKSAAIKPGDIVYKALACKHCGVEYDVADDTKTMICWKCVQQRLDPPPGFIPYDPVTRTFKEPIQKPKRPRGWRLMAEFVDSAGNVFFKGVEQPNLKGTREATPIKETKELPRQTKADKQKSRDKLLVELNKLKTQLKSETDKRKTNAIERKIENIQKELK